MCSATVFNFGDRALAGNPAVAEPPLEVCQGRAFNTTPAVLQGSGIDDTCTSACRQAQQVEARRQSIRGALSAGSAKLASLLDKTRAVKQLAEETLSRQLDRTVLIVGEINNLLD